MGCKVMDMKPDKDIDDTRYRWFYHPKYNEIAGYKEECIYILSGDGEDDYVPIFGEVPRWLELNDYIPLD